VLPLLATRTDGRVAHAATLPARPSALTCWLGTVLEQGMRPPLPPPFAGASASLCRCGAAAQQRDQARGCRSGRARTSLRYLSTASLVPENPRRRRGLGARCRTLPALHAQYRCAPSGGDRCKQRERERLRPIVLVWSWCGILSHDHIISAAR
jgi:hypothetical protein